MVKMIEECVAHFKDILVSFSESEDLTLQKAETELTEEIYGIVAEYLGALYEAKDEEILRNKSQRRADGLVVERRNDSRQILTVFGPVNYKRTYYRAANGYEYPVDGIAGIDGYSRVSRGISTGLVAAACNSSYENSTIAVTGGAVSRQTVMRKIRQVSVPQIAEQKEKKEIPVLQIDADEDHVALQNGRNVMVPIVSVYEGKEKVCKGRNRCKNIFHVSRYGENSDDFWETVLNEIEARYDISKTKVYLHADGGNWIQTAKSWLPNVEFVLDDYHKNKAIKKALSGIDRKTAEKYEKEIRGSFLDEDARLLTELRESMIASYPDREETIRNGMDYLIRFFDGIHPRAEDPENIPGGASEPHVQHILSERLSSTPKAWSEETLKHLVPVLAARRISYDRPSISVLSTGSKTHENRPKLKNTAGMIDPDSVIEFPAEAYKRTALGTALKAFGRQRF